MSNQLRAEADQRLIDTLRALIARTDPIPDRITADATAAFSQRTVDDELAELTYDSVLDDPDDASIPEGPRRLSFASDNLGVELHVGENGLRGRLVPPATAEIELRWPGGSAVAVTDHRGGFSMAAVPRGPFSLRCERGPATPSPVVTDWVTL